MVENPLSKKGWIGVALSPILLYILGGFLNEFGADLYNSSKTMVVQNTVLVIILLLGLGIVAGIAMVVLDFWQQKKQKQVISIKDSKNQSETKKISNESTAEFKRKKEDDWRYFPANVD
jgi:hypothetical protein